MQRPAKILVVRFSSIGDIVLTTPVVRALKTQLEGDTEIHYLTKESYKSILEHNPSISKLYTINESVDEVKETLFNENYDYVIDLHKNIRSAQLKAHLKKITFSFDKLNFKKFLLVAFGIDKLPEIHIVDRYLDALRGFGVKADDQGLEFFIPNEEEVNLEELPEEFRSGYLSWVIGAAHEGKQMPVEKVKEICSELNLPIVLIGGPEDKDFGEVVAGIGQNVYNACGIFSINQSASLIKQSKLVVSGDTGMMHVASAFKKNIISLWGCTVPKFGMYPYKPGKDSIIIEPEGLGKRPCSKLGNSCKYGMEERCISRISNSVIINAIKERF